MEGLPKRASVVRARRMHYSFLLAFSRFLLLDSHHQVGVLHEEHDLSIDSQGVHSIRVKGVSDHRGRGQEGSRTAPDRNKGSCRTKGLLGLHWRTPATLFPISIFQALLQEISHPSPPLIINVESQQCSGSSRTGSSSAQQHAQCSAPRPRSFSIK